MSATSLLVIGWTTPIQSRNHLGIQHFQPNIWVLLNLLPLTMGGWGLNKKVISWLLYYWQPPSNNDITSQKNIGCMMQQKQIYTQCTPVLQLFSVILQLTTAFFLWKITLVTTIGEVIHDPSLQNYSKIDVIIHWSAWTLLL